MLCRITLPIICLAISAIHADEFLPVHGTRASEICYDEYGCFTTAKPFGGTLQRPFSMLPNSPSAIRTKFYLYTKETRKNRTEISRSTTLGPWKASKPTKFFIHGFLDSTDNKPWWLDMKNALLQV
ncbi:hypothetical protein I4U23_017786, partial [Adineta vaga]